MIDQQLDRLIDKIVVIRSNPHYRVADVFYSRGMRFQDSREKVLELSEFDGSILKTYLLRNGGADPQNLGLLLTLIRAAAIARNYALPQADEVVVHIRAGDVVLQDWFLTEEIVPQIKASPARRCTIVTCFAFQEFHERGMWLFTDEKLEMNKVRLKERLSSIMEACPDKEIDIFSSRDIDQDLVYMVHSRYFVRDRGGFSELISDLRTLYSELERQAV